MWLPDLSAARGPIYLAIADRLAADVAEGRLPPAARLPTHRALAERLGVTVTTVSRAYAEAERRGLVSGEVGRGTFVAGVRPAARDSLLAPVDGVVDLTINRPAGEWHARELAAALAAVAAEGRLEDVVSYGPVVGAPAHRAAGAAWIGRTGLRVDPARVAVVSGAQHGLLVASSAVLRCGDLILTEQLTYPGFKPIAQILGLRVAGLPMDAEGVLPAAFADACRTQHPRALYVVPTHQNPTTATMSEARRREIARIAREADVAIVEDDVYGFLHPDPPPPIAAFAPERTIFVMGTSKALLPGLRIGFLAVPDALRGAAADAIRGISCMASTLPAEIVARWILDGTAMRMADQQRRENAARQAMMRARLGAWVAGSDPYAMHVWLPLPGGRQAAEFASAALARRVAVSPVEAFAVGRGPVAEGVRFCLGAVPRPQLDQALVVLAELLRGRDGDAVPLV